MYEFITPAGSTTPNGEERGKRKGFPLRRRNNVLAPQFTVFNFRIIPHFCEKEHCAPPCLYERRADARRTRGRAMQTARTARNGTKKAVSTLCRLWKTAFYFCFCVTVKRFCGFSPCLCPFSATQNCAVCFHRRKIGVYFIVYCRKAMPLTVFAAAALKV